MHTVYVYLLNEGSRSWRPTTAEKFSDDVYKLLATPNYDPEDEEWEFIPNTVVKVAEIELKDTNKQPVLVAVSIYKKDNEV